MKFSILEVNKNFKSIFIIECILIFTLILNVNSKMEQKLKQFEHISNAHSNFFSSFFQSLTSEQLQQNVVSSSFSAHIILSLLFHGAKGLTRTGLQTGLNLLDPDPIQEELKNLFEILREVKLSQLELINALYIDESFELYQHFLSIAMDNFKTSLKKMNSKDSISTTHQINQWIEEKTKGKITSIVGPNDIDEYTKVVLINAIYFKSSWLIPFESQLTEKRKFNNINNDEIYVSTMSKTIHLPHGYIKDLNSSFIKMNYLDEQFEFIIVLPNEKLGLYELEKEFSWEMISKAPYTTKEVELFLPKFKIETTVDLKEALKKLGFTDIFTENANFSLMTEKPLHVDRMLQKLFFEIDEKGSEAAVSTVAQMRTRRMIVEPETFIVDHPFIFIINHKPSSIPLFTGSIRNLGTIIQKDEL